MDVDTFTPDTEGLASVTNVFVPSPAMLCACVIGATLETGFHLSAAHGVWSRGGI